MPRFERFQATLAQDQAVYVTKSHHMFYLTGFTGEGAVYLSKNTCAVITDFRYVEQAQQQTSGCEILSIGTGLSHMGHANALMGKEGITTLFAETDHLTHAEYVTLCETVAPGKVEAFDNRLVLARACKDESEIACIRKAAEITDRAFDYLLTITRPGITEVEIMGLLYTFFLKNGSQSYSFSPIIASGPNSSLPHAIPQQRVLKTGDLVTFDIGCKIGGYCSDFTRTIALGDIDPELKKIYNIVLEANLRALALVKPGESCKAVDAAARDHIAACGYGDCFGHGTGHGVGLEIHEAPRLSTKTVETLAPGMVVTVEPGIYLPGRGGVRIEDLVLVTENGCDILSKSRKELITL